MAQSAGQNANNQTIHYGCRKVAERHGDPILSYWSNIFAKWPGNLYAARLTRPNRDSNSSLFARHECATGDDGNDLYFTGEHQRQLAWENVRWQTLKCFCSEAGGVRV